LLEPPSVIPTTEGKIRGWAFGGGRSVACANVDGKYLAVDGICPRCGFDLYRGKILDDAEVWGPEPHVACPTCAATYSLKTGFFGPEYKATGLAGFVNTWAKAATIGNAMKNVQAFIITKDDETGKVYYREQ
jgi:nitrite reductase/ring-hydroxylating ferredoxin subunit